MKELPMRIRNTILIVLFLSLALAAMMSVGLMSPAAPSIALAAGTPEASPDWKLAIKTISEESKTPAYTISVSLPVLESAANQIDAFNKAVAAFSDKTIADFKQNVQEAQNGPAPATGSDLIVLYSAFTTSRGQISVRFDTEFYIQSVMAHPAHAASSLNYDLATGKLLTLDDLFKPGAKYLEALATYCQDELKRQDRLLFPEGALPKPENYAIWNLSSGGLLITFDVYQVGAGAQGPSEVLVPYTLLGDLLRTDGPILW
jgi:hypothetical protein